jgi:tetratricopeptide (TPR) repeat protein
MTGRSAPAIFVVSAAMMIATVCTSMVGDGPAEPPPPPARVASAVSLTGEAIALYAKGEFPGACERFARAAAEASPDRALSESAASCFEGWGWQALGDRRPDEALVLFRQGLRQAPRAPRLLRGLAIAAVHAGHPDEALAPLEAAVRMEDDPQGRLLLALLYDRRDDRARSLEHVRVALAQDPAPAAARRLLERLERERRTESGFDRSVTADFVVRAPRSLAAERRRRILRLLDEASAHVRGRLGYRPDGRLTVVLYDRDDFATVTERDGASGAFDGKIRLAIGPTDPVGPELGRVVRHEYAHAAIHALTRGRSPRWLHEGLAQVLEGAVVNPMLRVPGSPTLAGVEALVGDPEPGRSRTGYDLSLWIVGDLLDRGGMTAMRALLGRLGAGEPLGTALAREYGLSASELEMQWRHVLGG